MANYEFGVLFIHGIGNQHRADTLLEFGGRLVRWLEGRARELGGEKAGYRVELLDAALTEHPGTDQAPANVAVRLRRPGGESTWLLAESHWADVFPQPKFADLARWSFLAAPITVATHFEMAGERRLRRLWLSLLSLLMSTLALLLFPFLLLFSLLALLPIAGLRRFVVALQRGLARSIGDSFAMVANPIVAATIQRRVRDDLKWLLAGCDRVAVVGHSQGAAVAFDLLSGDELAEVLQPDERPVPALVTLGSGLKKLDPLRAAMRRGPQDVWSLAGAAVGAPFGYALVAFAVLAVGFGAIEVWNTRTWDDFHWVVFGALMFLAVGSGLLGRWWETVSAMGRPSDDLGRSIGRLAGRRIDWHDFYSTHDIVPNGAQPGVGAADGATFETVEVTNAHSRVFDHSAYWRSTDDFVPKVVRILAVAADDGTATWLPLLDSIEGEAARRRRRRKRAFAVALALSLGVTVAAAVAVYMHGWWRAPVAGIAGRYEPPVPVWAWIAWSVSTGLLLAGGVALEKKVDDLSLIAYQGDRLPLTLNAYLASVQPARSRLKRVLRLPWTFYRRPDAPEKALAIPVFVLGMASVIAVTFLVWSGTVFPGKWLQTALPLALLTVAAWFAVKTHRVLAASPVAGPEAAAPVEGLAAAMSRRRNGSDGASAATPPAGGETSIAGSRQDVLGSASD